MPSPVGTPGFLAGIAFLSVDGTPFNVVGNAKYSVASVTREGLVGIDRPHGFKESPRFGSISASLRDSGGLTVQQLNDMTNVTVVLQLANGKNVMASNAFTSEAQEVDAVDATIEVTWQAEQVTEI
jgi:hypothetical protein